MCVSGREPAERALERAAQVEERGLQLRADPLARGGAELGLAGEHELDAEQALDHRLVHLAREVHPLLQLAGLGLLVGRQAREGGERGGLAERPQQVALGVAQRRAVRAAVGEDHAEPAAGGGHRRADERRLADQVAELGRHALGRRAGDLDHAVLDAASRARPGRSRPSPGRRRRRRAGCRTRPRRGRGGARRRSGRSRRGPCPRAGRSPRTGGCRRRRWTGRPRRARAARRTSRARRCGPSARWERCGSPSSCAERYSPSRRATPARSNTRRTAGDARRTENDQPLLSRREVRVHQRRQPGRVHERDLGEIELDRRGPGGAGGAASRPARARWRCPVRREERASDPRGGRRPP